MQEHTLLGLKNLLEIRLIEPQGFQSCGPIVNQYLEDGEPLPPGGLKMTIQDGAQNGHFFARFHIGDLFEMLPVFIAIREAVKGVLSGLDARFF